MTTVAVDVTSVTLPTPNPWPYGLIGAATIIDRGDGHWLSGAEAETVGCSELSGDLLPDWCAGWAKSANYAGPKWLVGQPLVVPMLGQCNAVGLDVPGLNTKMRAAFDLAESRELEARFVAWVTAAPGVVDVAGTGLTPVAALAAMEDAYAENGGVAQPTAHVSRGTATLLTAGGGAKPTGGRLETLTGTTIAAYTAPLAGAAYLSGPVTFVRGELHVYDPVLDQQTNIVTVLMERAYLMFVDDCAVVATTVGA